MEEKARFLWFLKGKKIYRLAGNTRTEPNEENQGRMNTHREKFFFAVEEPRSIFCLPKGRRIRIRGFFVDMMGKAAKQITVEVKKESYWAKKTRRPDVLEKYFKGNPAVDEDCGFELVLKLSRGLKRIDLYAELQQGQKLRLGFFYAFVSKTEIEDWYLHAPQKTEHWYLHSPKKAAIMINDSLLIPDKKGGDFRAFQILKMILEKGWEVYFATFLSRFEIPLGEGKREEELKRYEKLLLDLGIKAIFYGESELEEFLSNFGSQFSLAYVFHELVAYRFLPLIRTYAINGRVIYDTVDLAFVRLRREALTTGNDQLKKEARLSEKRDKSNFKGVDIVVAITEEEKELIKGFVPERQVEVIPNIHEIHRPKNSWESRQGLLFLGYFGHRPNVDALRYFLSEIWEKIQGEIPGCRFDIVGSFLKENVPMEFLNYPGVNPVGYVADLAECFEKVRVFVAPLRYGAGMKGKIGMAMASGLPVVTTSIGAEGMKLENGKNAFVCDDPSEFARQTVRLYKDKELWEKLSRASLEHVERYFSKEALKDTLERLFSYPFS